MVTGSDLLSIWRVSAVKFKYYKYIYSYIIFTLIAASHKLFYLHITPVITFKSIYWEVRLVSH